MTLKRQFLIGLCATFFVCSVLLVGMRLLAKGALFHHLERDHMEQVMLLDAALELVEHEAKNAGTVTRSQLLSTIDKAKQIAAQPEKELLTPEIWAFQLLGYSFVVDLPRKDILELDRMRTMIEAEPGEVTTALVAKLAKDRAAVMKNSRDFGILLVDAVEFVKVAVLVLALFCIVVLFYTVWRLRRGTLPPLETALAAAETIARGDLSRCVEVKSQDEVGHLLHAIEAMRVNLRDVIARTVNISSGIASASNQLQTTSGQIARAAEEVASQAATVATASEEMAATSSDIAKNCTMAADASQESTAAANAGATVVQETLTGMRAIAERVRQTSRTVETLGSRSEQIGDIVGTIEDIADQTNLLALNAAIEAARAGDQGRGFAVVADEVRALAERTTKATREIGEMIKGIQNETKAAIKAMEEGVAEVEKGAVSSQKSGQALEEIVNRIVLVSRQVTNIATAAEEQNATTNEVTDNVHRITDVVHQTAGGAEQTAAAAAQLARQSQDLQSLVGRFQLS